MKKDGNFVEYLYEAMILFTSSRFGVGSVTPVHIFFKGYITICLNQKISSRLLVIFSVFNVCLFGKDKSYFFLKRIFYLFILRMACRLLHCKFRFETLFFLRIDINFDFIWRNRSLHPHNMREPCEKEQRLHREWEAFQQLAG